MLNPLIKLTQTGADLVESETEPESAEEPGARGRAGGEAPVEEAGISAQVSSNKDVALDSPAAPAGPAGPTPAAPNKAKSARPGASPTPDRPAATAPEAPARGRRAARKRRSDR